VTVERAMEVLRKCKRAGGAGQWPAAHRPVQGGFRHAAGRAGVAFGAAQWFATCLRLEAVYWRILERIAQANRCSVSAVLSYVDREVHLRHGGVRNFSGLVRVICVAWLQDAPDTR
jgi:hypothetical protein